MVSHAWVQYGLIYAAEAAGLAALQPAIRGPGHRHYDFTLAFFVPLFSLIFDYIRDRAYWKLTRGERWRVWTVRTTAVPTGDAKVDEMALRRLADARGRRSRAYGATLGVVGLLLIAGPIVATFRANVWWLLSAVPSLVLVVVWAPTLRLARTSEDRLTRLNAALDSEALSS